MNNRSMIHVFLAICLSLSLAAQAQQGGFEELRQTGKAFSSVAKSVSPSVVFIQVEGMRPAPSGGGFPWPFGEDFFKRFFGEEFPGAPQTPQPGTPPGQRRAIGQGSGFVFKSREGLLSDKAYILTNNHVVANAERIQVKFRDGRQFDAEVVGRDPQSDVAVIEIEASGVPALTWGDSAQLDVGEWVIAIGSPFGLSHTLTVGVVSATGRTTLGINDYEDFIQTDAAINPGNSGGPLVNLNGEVIGVNTAIFSRSGGYMGIGFAIPSTLARTIADQLIEHGEVTRGYLGIVIQQLTPELAASFDISAGQGILVAQVNEDSPAEAAGLRQGDVIVSFRGEPVKNVGSFRNRVSLTAPGSTEKLVVLRDGERKTLQVTIGKLTPGKLAAAEPAQTADELGLTVQTLTPELAEQFDTRPGEGVLVTGVRSGSIAATAGIEPGTVILQVNRMSVETAAQFRQAIAARRDERRALLLIRNDGMQRYLALSW